MWLWIALLWCVAAVAFAVVHHRMRRAVPRYPAAVRGFVLRFENELATAHPGVQFLGMLPERFACLLCIDGQETPVGLHDAFRHAEAFPDGFAAMVAQLIAEIRSVGLDRAEELEFATASALLLPQVRSADWLRQQGTFGDSGLVHTALNDDLVVVYVIDDANSMVFVCRAHLQRWRKTVADVHSLAVANLARAGRDLPAVNAERPLLLQSGDGFDAARLLLLEQQEGLLVAVPDRDTLWAGSVADQDLARLMATTEAIAEHAPHPVSGRVFRVMDGRLEAVSDPD